MYPYEKYQYRHHEDRFVPVAAPFLLGALTGGVAVAAFNPYRPRPVYNYGPPTGYYGNYGYGGYIPY